MGKGGGKSSARGGGGAGTRSGGSGPKDRSEMTQSEKDAEIKAVDNMQFKDVNVKTFNRYNDTIVSNAETQNTRVQITQRETMNGTEYNVSMYSGGKIVGMTQANTLSQAKSRAREAMKDYYKGYNF